MMKESPRKGWALCQNVLLSLLLSFLLMGFQSLPGWSAEIPYPVKPINMIVPFSAGGGSDLASKVIADKIAEFLGQPLISVHKPGGGGSLGTTFVAKAKPDGYTLLVGGSYYVPLMPILKKLDYRLEDFTLMGAFGKVPVQLAVKADARWNNLKEFIEEEKKFPRKLKIGSMGKLSFGDFALELLNKYAGVRITHIPYKSSGEALTAVLGGHVDGAMVAGSGGLADAGSVRIIAVAEGQRLEGLPNVPTFKEFGYPVEIPGWYSLCFPKGVSTQIVNTFYAAQEKAFKRYSKEIKEELRRVDIWAEFYNPEDTFRLFKKQSEFLFKVAQELGVVEK